MQLGWVSECRVLDEKTWVLVQGECFRILRLGETKVSENTDLGKMGMNLVLLPS